MADRMAFEASRRRGRRDAVVLAAPPVLSSMGTAGWGGGWVRQLRILCHAGLTGSMATPHIHPYATVL